MKPSFRNSLVKTAILSMMPLAGQAAVTFTNEFATGDPALAVVENDFQYQAWDISKPYANQKNWDVASGDGSVAVSGWATLPQSYIDQYPAAAGAGGAMFRATTTFNSLIGFKVSELTEVSFRYSLGENHTASNFISVSLFTETGEIYGLNTQTSTLVSTRSGPGDTGDYIRTFSNFTADPNDRTYIGLMFNNNMTGTFTPGVGMSFDRGQFVDATFQSATVSIPEPSAALLGLAGVALLFRRRRVA